eukprot:m.87617 g.87617  ORF g.87617 m.87617 type:complete len:339 (+) comp14916_c0_seq1:783-1799(+)
MVVCPHGFLGYFWLTSLGRASSQQLPSLQTRVYLCGGTEETAVERMYLERAVLPHLQAWAANFCGQGIHVVDLHSTAMHHVTNFRQVVTDEMFRCCQTSPNIKFIAFAGDEIGPLLPPAVIHVQEFSRLLDACDDPEVQLLQTWYQEDINAVPPVFRIKPLDGATDNSWRETAGQLHAALAKAASTSCDADQLKVYQRDLTQEEFDLGRTLAQDTNTWLWLKRSFVGALTEVEASRIQGATVDAVQQQFRTFVRKDAVRHAQPSHVASFKVDWKSGGIDPVLHADHSKVSTRRRKKKEMAGGLIRACRSPNPKLSSFAAVVVAWFCCVSLCFNLLCFF